MANIIETNEWTGTIYSIDINDPVIGGENGIDNIPHIQLANRTIYLKARMEAVASELETIQNEINSITPASIGAAPLIHTHEDLNEPASKIAYFARQTPPDGWLECNGAEVSRTQYARLFAAIGTIFGAGDGSTTFKLPDLRGEFIRAWEHGKGVDFESDGITPRKFGGWQPDEFKAHKHGIGYMLEGTDGVSNGEILGGTTGYVNTELTGGKETRPRNVALLVCIKC